MQTFLPYPDFSQSAAVLDRQRLGKQRVECLQIALAISRPTYPWQNHPAVNMWRGHLPALVLYAWTVCDEWTSRGYRDDIKRRLNIVEGTQIVYPPWLGDEEFHSAHRSKLYYKMPEHYGQFVWKEMNQKEKEYVWPTKTIA